MQSIRRLTFPLKPRQLTAAPSAEFIAQEEVRISTLDTLVTEEAFLDEEGTFLKIDVQDYEEEVLAGAQQTLSRLRVSRQNAA